MLIVLEHGRRSNVGNDSPLTNRVNAFDDSDGKIE